MARSISKILALAISIIVFTFSVQNISFSRQSPPISAAMPDISGVAWVGGRNFLAVHDAKNPELPRMSLLSVPDNTGTLSWRALTVDRPSAIEMAKDLESITAIPGTDLFLAAESGDKKNYRRLFLLTYKNENVKIIAETPWPVAVQNVEAIAVTEVNNRYLFLYAERAEGWGSTEIRWTDLSLDPLRFGEFRSISFSSPFGSGEFIRQISDIAIDRSGNLYIASTRDPGDAGIFQSAIYRIGRMDGENVVLDSRSRELARLDGLKVEGLTFRKDRTGDRLFFGTDDENYGGVFRPLGKVK
jgi:hypothetical protein